MTARAYTDADAERLAHLLWDRAKRSAGAWVTRCPLHDDDSPSCSITAKDGKLLVRCHAGCDQREVFKACTERLKAANGHDAEWQPKKRSSKPKAAAARPEPTVITPVPADAAKPAFHHPGDGVALEHYRWAWHDAEGRILFYTCRWDKPGGKKEVRPYCYAARDDGHRMWSWRAHPAPRQLYRLRDLLARRELPVLLVEGEKTAEAIAAVVGRDWCVTTWAGGSGASRLTDFSPLIGRHVTIWPDADKAGEKVATEIYELLDGEGDGTVTILTPPPGEKSGFDAADAVEQWPVSRLAAYLKGSIPEEAPRAAPQEANIQALGVTPGRLWFWSSRMQEVLSLAARDLTEPQLLQVMTLEDLRAAWPAESERGYNIADARDALIEAASLRGNFAPESVRATGVWPGAILNTGRQLSIKGRTHLLGPHDGHVYAAGRALDVGKPASDQQAKAVVDLLKTLRWRDEASSTYLLGWLVLAPLAGMLQWRPNVWVCGESGSGKSWLMKHIVRPLLGSSALYVIGDTTEAGIRQSLGAAALPVVFDEAEQDNVSAADRIERLLALMRTTTQDGAEIIKGTTQHHSARFPLRTCFLLGSVVAGGLHRSADRSRITVLELLKDAGGVQFPHVKAALAEVKIGAPEILARMLSLEAVLRGNIATCTEAATAFFGDSRTGDQIGTLLAGAATFARGKPVTGASITQWLDGYASVSTEPDDAHECLDAILSISTRVLAQSERQTVQVDRRLRELVGRLSDPRHSDGTSAHGVLIDGREAVRALKVFGLRVEDGRLWLANQNEDLVRELRGTAFARGWATYLRRLPGAEDLGPKKFGHGNVQRAVAVPLNSGGEED